MKKTHPMWKIVKPCLFDQVTSRLLSPERQAKKSDGLVLRKAVQKAIFREARRKICFMQQQNL